MPDLIAGIAKSELAKLRNKGLTGREIAAHLGVSESSLYNARRAYGLPRQSVPGPKPLEFDRVEFRRLWVSGVSVAKMAAQFEVSPATISKWSALMRLPTREGSR